MLFTRRLKIAITQTKTTSALSAFATILIWFTFCNVALAEEGGKIELVYSANDHLCGILADVFERLHKQYPEALTLDQTGSSLFVGTGLSAPSKIPATDPMLKAFSSRSGDDSYFFRANVAEDGRQRLVYIDNFHSFSDINEYLTDVFIFKPGAGYRTIDIGYPTSNAKIPDVDPDVVDLLISGQGAAPWRKSLRYPLVSPPEGVAFPLNPRPSEAAKRFVRVGFGASAEQYAFEFGRRVYFVMGLALSNAAVVYRITSELKPETVCLMDSNQNLNDLKRHRLWP